MKIPWRWKETLKQNVARFLVACMIVTLIPTSVITMASAAQVVVKDEEELREAYETVSNGDIIRLSNDIFLSQPLQWDRDISITIDGSENRYSILPAEDFPTAPYEQQFLINITKTDVHFYHIIIDGKDRVGGINIYNDCSQEQNYHFDAMTVKSTNRGAGNGSGVSISSYSDSVPVTNGFTGVNSTRVTIDNGTIFTQNYLAPDDSSSFGAALYTRGNVLVNIDDATFSKNTACSGGAISQTYSYITMTSQTVFTENRAGQRGGAIICNGPLVMDGTQISGNTSDQFGGAIFVAAHTGNHGQVVMKNGASITGNTANSAGGGMYISDEAEVYLDEASNGQPISVTNNRVPSAGGADNEKNNIFVAAVGAKLYVASAHTKGEIGVSTQNPYKSEDLVWSTTTEALNTTPNGSAKGLNGCLQRMGVATYQPYSIQTNFTEDQYALFVYDSEVYQLVKSTTGNDAIMLTYGEAAIVFDLNLPGQPAEVVEKVAAGSVIKVPDVQDQTVGNTKFTFLGWYTEAEGGQKVTTVTGQEAGVVVYYAHWKVESTGGGSGGGSIGTGSLRIVYFDQNTGSGGLTSAYILAGDFTITIYDDEGNSEEKTVTLPFAWPEDPARKGYDFKGWGDTPDATTPVNTNIIPDNGETLFAIWEAHTHTLTWDANGGQGGTTTTQKYDELIVPPAQEPTREGYTFGGWYIDQKCTVPMSGDMTVTGDQTFYASWLSEKVIVTYYDSREGTSVVGTQEYNYGDVLNPLGPITNTSGQTFVRWETEDGQEATGIGELNNAVLTYHKGNNGDDVSSADGYWVLDLYAVWAEETTDYIATIKWNDLQNNDGCRPQSVKLGLISSVNNRLVGEATVPDDGTDVQTYTFTDLPITTADTSVEKITYSVFLLGYTDADGTYREIKDTAASSGEIIGSTSSNYDDAVFTTYRYAINNYTTGATAAEYSGSIFLDHDLITTGDDIQFSIQWEDESDNDGKRPGAVTLVLYADEIKVKDNPLHNSDTGVVSASTSNCKVSDDGNVWTYTFEDFQKYNAGQAINYTVAVTNPDETTKFDLNDYSTTYLNSKNDAVGDANGAIISRAIELTDKTVTITWDDESNRDGIRPENVVVTLSAYQWNNKTYR